MLTYILRRLLVSIPTLLVISLVVFLLLALAPGDPMSGVPLTIDAEVRARMVDALGLDQPLPVRFWKWLVQMFWVEPLYATDWLLGTDLAADRERVLSWQTRAPAMDLVVQRLPQTLWVVGGGFLVGILIALPIGIYSAYRHYSVFDQAGTFVAMIGFSVPPFFSGVLVILVFAIWLGWFPSVYDTTVTVEDWDSLKVQLRQMAMPVMVIALQITALISRYMRASMLDNLSLDYVRTARAKGMSEWVVVLRHVLRNSMIPVVTVIALAMPGIFGGAIITEQLFGVNGLGQLLITGIRSSDLPLVQTLTFIFAVLIVLCNLIADVLYGVLDPRIRYD